MATTITATKGRTVGGPSECSLYMLGTRGVWPEMPRGSGTGFLIISILGHLSVPGLPDSDSDSDARYSITELSVKHN